MCIRDRVCAKVTRENDGLITHYPYEIGTEFRSAETNYQYYQLNMDQDADGDGNGDVVVWYCLSGDADNPDSERGKVYKNTKNDARNNYYIYSIGNVTYSGMGNSELDLSLIHILILSYIRKQKVTGLSNFCSLKGTD